MLILAAAFLTVLAVMLLVRLPENQKSITVPEKNGVYDLTRADSLDVPVIRLEMSGLYYPGIYLEPENVNTALPENIPSNDEIRVDYLSQRFVLLLPDNSDVYTLTFKLSGRHAMRVLVNGSLAGQTGYLGTTKQDTEVWENNITVHASVKEGKMDIILHSAQFYHVKRGASLAELSLSKGDSAMDSFGTERIKGLLIMGALLSAAISLLGIYLLLVQTKATLYFALACVSMALRECLQSQAWTYFPIPGNISFMLEYLSMVLVTIFLSLYLGQYAPGKRLRGVRAVAIIGSVIYGLCILFGDSLFYTSVLKYYQFLLILCIVPGIAGVFGILRHPTKEQTAALYGITVFFLSAVADILMYLDLFGSGKNLPISEETMLIFAIMQVFSLFLMNNRILSEAKEAEQKLELEKTALENLSRLKTKFLSNVSHELKTPLTVVSGHAQLLGSQLAGPEYAVARDKARIISSEADRLALMVGQVLDVTRIEENRLTVEKCPCHIDELTYRAVETHFPILNKGNNRLEINVGLDLPEVNCDPGRITQVLVNLIANALRYTEQGVITVAAKEKEGFIEISVSDTGTGMSEEEISNLFTRYRPGRGGTGTGLGLYICKYLVGEHGGSIWVESAVGKGTTVTFSLPL